MVKPITDLAAELPLRYNHTEVSGSHSGLLQRTEGRLEKALRRVPFPPHVASGGQAPPQPQPIEEGQKFEG